MTRVHVSIDLTVKTCDKILPSPYVMNVYNNIKFSNFLMPTNFFPLRVPSMPWLNQSIGGYLLTKSDLVR